MNFLIQNATIVNEGTSFCGSVLVGEGKIEEIFPASQIILKNIAEGAQTIDATGLLLLPGVIDTHVHFREPGLTHKATWSSESRAAVAGGVTSVVDMPNTIPQTTSVELVREKLAIAARNSAANYGGYLGATADNLDEVAKLKPEDGVFAVKLFMGSSTGNMLLDDEKLLSKLFAECPLPIVAHCEDDALIKHNLEAAKKQFGENIPFTLHSKIRSAEACYNATSRAVVLAKKYGARLHVAHISTARELGLFGDSPKITAETCPQYLWFCNEDYAEKAAFVKCNPAIKTAADRTALRCAVAADTISTIATDHAPHTLSEKQGSYLNAPSGLPLVQHSLVSMLELVRQGEFSVETLVEKMCHAPARIFSIGNRGYIRKGYAADLVLVKPEAWQVSAENTLHRCGWSAFSGCTFAHRVTHTFVNGHLAYAEGTVADTPHAQTLNLVVSG
ncbi:MAG: dihydroorotase [Prevotellaceae bacterium]|jgi:dihydroorotase|nr:dihydroorotase [Prevotellaceae bacterium]